MKHVCLFTMVVFLLAAARVAGAADAPEEAKTLEQNGPPPIQFTLKPIGQVQQSGGRTTIVLNKKYQPGLLGMGDWSHVWVFWWFDRNDTPQRRAILQVNPRGNPKNPLTGVFATRSPVRPNLIALSLCKIISVKDNVIEVEKIDAFPGTPVLDLKPYARGIDSANQIRVPAWTGRGKPPQ